jgi:hypothetical protein
VTPEHASIYGKVTELLARLGARDVEHLNNDLEAHLQGTYALLTAWRAPESTRLAGLLHALYGTFGFERALVSRDARPEVAALIGDEAEALVYFYCACDRSFCYPQLARSDTPLWRDRFTSAEFHPPGVQLAAFCELTLANEIDVAQHDRTHWHLYLPLFRSVRFAAHVSAAGLDAFRRCSSSLSV